MLFNFRPIGIGWVLLVMEVAEVYNQGIFTEVPGNVSALYGGQVVLNWSNSLDTKNIEWCYWNYYGCDSCPKEEFFGYHAQKGGRQNISSRSQGWLFVNEQRPCNGGIWRKQTDQKHNGLYQMTVIVNRTVRHVSPRAKLQLYKESDLKVQVKTGNTSRNFALQEERDQPVKLEPIHIQQYESQETKLAISEHFPPTANMVITKNNSEGVGFIIEQCLGQDGKSCQFVIFLGNENDIQNAPPSHSAEVVALIVVTTILASLILVMGVILLVLWRKRAKASQPDHHKCQIPLTS